MNMERILTFIVIICAAQCLFKLIDTLNLKKRRTGVRLLHIPLLVFAVSGIMLYVSGRYNILFESVGTTLSVSVLVILTIICTLISVMTHIRMRGKYMFPLSDYANITTYLVVVYTVMNISIVLQ